MLEPGATVEDYSKVYEAEYAAGDKFALARMIVVCAIRRCAIPKWAAETFEGAVSYALTGDIKSWDEVFGKPARRKVDRKWMYMDRVYFEVLAAKGKGEAIDDLLFERIGKQLKIGGKTKVKELYRA